MKHFLNKSYDLTVLSRYKTFNIMKPLKVLFFIVAFGTTISCTDNSLDNPEDMECLLARYRGSYCSANERLEYIEFLQPSKLASQFSSDNSDSIVYAAAVLDLPAFVLKTDTSFIIKVRRDLMRESTIKINTCPAIFSKMNILVCDEILQQPCQIISK